MIENVPFNSLEQAVVKAHNTKDLKFLLIPWLSFRAYVVFTGKERKKGHFYGNEHQCTYNQCMYGKVPNIVLRKSKGYSDLIHFIENAIKGKYTTAKIYMRNPETREFDLLCREYYKGGLEKKEDPLISDDEGFTLYYFLKKGRVEITETDPLTENFKIEL